MPAAVLLLISLMLLYEIERDPIPLMQSKEKNMNLKSIFSYSPWKAMLSYHFLAALRYVLIDFVFPSIISIGVAFIFSYQNA